MAAPQLQRYDILLFDGFSNHCLANTVEPLRAANSLTRRNHYSWRFFTLDGSPVTSSSGLTVSPHSALSQADGTALFVMPSYGVRDLVGRPVRRFLAAAAWQYHWIAGLDTGSWLLAEAGLLDGCRATIHWDELSAFSEAFPNVDACRERYVIDRDRITCSGAMSAFDLIQHLIATDHGELLALEIGHFFMARDGARMRGETPTARGRSVSRAVAIMQESLEMPLSIRQIARRAGCSQRILEQRFRAELNTTPRAVYRRLRLTLARRLITGTDQRVSEIAGRCGYDNASAMTRALKAAFGQTPRDLRSGAANQTD